MGGNWGYERERFPFPGRATEPVPSPVPPPLSPRPTAPGAPRTPAPDEVPGGRLRLRGTGRRPAGRLQPPTRVRPVLVRPAGDHAAPPGPPGSASRPAAAAAVPRREARPH